MDALAVPKHILGIRSMALPSPISHALQEIFSQKLCSACVDCASTAAKKLLCIN